MYFEVGGKATRDYIILYNNTGFISKGAEDVASESPENIRFRLLHCRLMPRLQGTATNIRINLTLYCQKRQSLRYIFALIVWVYLH